MTTVMSDERLTEIERRLIGKDSYLWTWLQEVARELLTEVRRARRACDEEEEESFKLMTERDAALTHATKSAAESSSLRAEREQLWHDREDLRRQHVKSTDNTPKEDIS